MSEEGRAAAQQYFEASFPDATVDSRSDKDSLGRVFLIKDARGVAIHRVHLTRELLDRKGDEVNRVLERHAVAQRMRGSGTTIINVSSNGIYGQTEEA